MACAGETTGDSQRRPQTTTEHQNGPQETTEEFKGSRTTSVTAILIEASNEPATVAHLSGERLLNPRPITLVAVAMIFFLPALSMLLFVVVYRLRQRRRQYHEQVDTEAQALVQ